MCVMCVIRDTRTHPLPSPPPHYKNTPIHQYTRTQVSSKSPFISATWCSSASDSSSCAALSACGALRCSFARSMVALKLTNVRVRGRVTVGIEE